MYTLTTKKFPRGTLLVDFPRKRLLGGVSRIKTIRPWQLYAQHSAPSLGFIPKDISSIPDSVLISG